MNIREMQYQFGIQLNQFDDALELDSDDIQYWLNKAQYDIVKSRYSGYTADQRGFEQSQRRIDDIRQLFVRGTKLDYAYVNTSPTFPDATEGYLEQWADFPSNYMFLISSRSKIAYNFPTIAYTTASQGDHDVATPSNPYVSRIVFNRYATADTIYKLLDDPFNKTKPSSPISIISENMIYIIADETFIVTDIYIDYIRKPQEMNIKGNVDCELPEHLHEEIVQRAVDLLLNNTRQLKQRLQRETPIEGET